MQKQILRVRLTNNVRQLKKYIDEAIEKGAETIAFDMDKENPYFIFNSDFTPEQENLFEIDQLKTEFESKLKSLEKKKYKTHSFRISKWGLSGSEINVLVKAFEKDKQIKGDSVRIIKQIINDEYDDFNDEMQTVFITETLEN